MISALTNAPHGSDPDVVGRPRVLVVDDQEDIRALLQMWLSSHFEIILATDGMDAMRLLREGESFDAALLDVMMPKIDGFAVAKAIHQLHPDAPIVMLSAIADQANRDRGDAVGVAKYLPKPFDPLQLRSTLQALTRRTGTREIPTDDTADPVRNGCGWTACATPHVPQPLCNVHQQLSDATGTFELRADLHAEVVNRVRAATGLSADTVSAIVHRPRTAADADIELAVRHTIRDVLTG